VEPTREWEATIAMGGGWHPSGASRIRAANRRVGLPLVVAGVDLSELLREVAALDWWARLTWRRGEELLRGVRLEVAGMSWSVGGMALPARRLVRINPESCHTQTPAGAVLTTLHELTHLVDAERVRRAWSWYDVSQWHGERFQMALCGAAVELFGLEWDRVLALRGPRRDAYAMDEALREAVAERACRALGPLHQPFEEVAA
jgi:hypothetical protein